MKSTVDQRFHRTKMIKVPLYAFILAAGLHIFPKVLHSANPAQICDAVAVTISKETSVPIEVLRTITRTETGRGTVKDLKPWPWTVNMEGKGVWFDTETQARAYVFRHFKNGARSFDIGCFQINYRWHHQAFKSIEEMFDPTLNARYAAQFLLALYREMGDWNKAVGAYHSRTDKHAKRYLKRYTEIREKLPQTENIGIQETHLITRTTRNRGSLVPLRSSSARSLFAQGGGPIIE